VFNNDSFWVKFRNFFTGSVKNENNQTNYSKRNEKIDQIKNFNQILQTDNIVLQVEVSSKNELLKYLSDLAVENKVAIDSELLYGKYLLRERSSSTALGDGVSLPHIQDASIKRTTMMVVKLANPIEWDSNEKIDVVISLLTSDSEVKFEHVTYLATISKLLLNSTFSQSLKSIQDKDDLLKLFNK